MKISDLWDRHAEQTRKLTEIAKTLAFANAAICWFFKSENVTFPTPVILSLFFVVAYFISELLQYLTASVVYGNYIEGLEKKVVNKGQDLNEFEVKGIPRKLNTRPYLFFYLKLAFLFCAFIALGVEFVLRMFS